MLKTKYGGKGYYWYTVVLGVLARTQAEAVKIVRTMIGSRHIATKKITKGNPVS